MHAPPQREGLWPQASLARRWAPRCAHCGAHASKGADSDASDSAPFLRHAWSLLAESRLAAGDGKEAASAFAALERRDPVRANYWAFRRAHVEGRLLRGDGR